MIGNVRVTATMGLGTRLKAIREYLGYNRDVVGAKAKLATGELEAIEDRGAIPDTVVVKRLAKLYKVPPRAIYGDDNHPALDMDVSELCAGDRKEIEDFATYLRWRKEYRERRDDGISTSSTL